MTTTASPCKSFTKKGQPCKARALPNSEYCLFHDPDMIGQRMQGRAAGGHARHGRKLGAMAAIDLATVEPITPDQLMRLLGVAAQDVLTLEPSHNRVRTIATLVTSAAKAFEVHEIAKMIEELEQGNGQS